MAHYDASEIVQNIEDKLEEIKGSSSELSEKEQQSRFRTKRLQEKKRSVFRRLEKEVLPRMREFQSVDRVPPGSRFRLFKQVFSRVFRMFTAPQAAYNYSNLEAVLTLSNEIDKLRQQVQKLEDGPTRPFGAVGEMESAEDKRHYDLVNQHLQAVQRNLDYLTRNLGEMSSSLGTIVDNISAVSGRVNTMNVSQFDTKNEVSSTRTEISRLWTELGLVYESIDQRAEDLWTGLHERDVQLSVNTEATQSLHGQVGSIEAHSKELRARLLVLGEQLAIHQEMLENVREELSDSPPSRRRSEPRPAGDTTRETRGHDAEEVTQTPRKDSHFFAAQSSQVESDPLITRQLDLAYLRFQRQYRGDEKELRERQSSYNELLLENLQTELKKDEKPRLLDVACGDGVFIDILNKKGWDAIGIDVNDAMVKQGKARGLNIESADAVAYLSRVEPKSLDVVSMLQFVEHLPPPVLMKILKDVYRALKPNGLILIETINPHTMKALHWFYFDLSHERLIFPEMMQLLAETAGFQTLSFEGINTVSPENQLKVAGDKDNKENIEKLNKFLFGNQDYYFLARRPSAQKT